MRPATSPTLVIGRRINPYEHRCKKFTYSGFSEVQHSPVPLLGAFGTERRLFSPKHNLMFAERTSMVAHIYPPVLEAVSRRGYAGCLDRCFQGCQGEAMQDLGYELPRILLPRTPVNKEQREIIALSSACASLKAHIMSATRIVRVMLVEYQYPMNSQ